jgi:CRISPR-associated protein Cas2
MIVMLLEKVPLRLRGELSRWLIEPQSGVFVGHVNAMVRNKLWEKCSTAKGVGGVVQVWSTNNEQRFAIRTSGETSRRIVEIEGLQLIQIPLNVGEDVEEKIDQP